MPTYECINRATGATDFRYEAAAPVAYDQFPDSTHEHVKVAEDAPAYVLPEGSPAWATLCDIGPFMDRFGAAKYPILASTDPSVVAIREDMRSRKYIDVADAPAHEGVAALKALLPTIVTDEVARNALRLPVSLKENFALRMTYFNGEGGRG